MKRKILALTLSLCLCLPLFPLSARGAEDDRLKPGCQRSYYYYLTEEERPLYDFFWESMEDLLAGEACQYTTVGVGKFDRNQWLRAALAFRDDHPAEVAVVVLRGPWGRGWWLDEETDLMQWEWTMELENDDYYYNWMEEYGGRDPAADFLRIKATVKDLAAQCRAAGPSRYDQLLYLHDWLTHNNYYNWTATEEDDYDSNHDDNAPWTAAGALLPEYQPVCEGYSSAFRAVCNELEIPCLMPSSIWTNHAWNLVQMEDGQWYHVDVTSDDPGRSTELVSGRENHTYFLRSDTFFFGDESLGFGENDETGYWPLASKVDYDPSKKPTASTSTPTPTPTPAPTVPTAAPSNQTVTVDGKKVEFAMYSTEGGSFVFATSPPS